MTSKSQTERPTTEEFVNAVVSGQKLNITCFNVLAKNFLNNSDAVDLKNCRTSNVVVETFYDKYGKSVEDLVHKHVCSSERLKSLTTKSSELSDAFRSKGNDFYKQKKAKEALRCYSVAIAFAPESSNSLALGYSNRSACFLQLGDVTKCIREIARFEDVYGNQSDDLYKKLQERKQKCLDLQEQYPDEHAFGGKVLQNFCSRIFKLSSENWLIPSADSRLGIRENEERGRHIVNASSETIPPGEVIIMEKPFSAVLLQAYSFEYIHCTGCFKDLEAAGVPCNCVFAMYCSETCRDSNRHSQTECDVSPFLYEINMDRTIHLSLSTILKLKSLDNVLSLPPPGAKYDSTDYATIHHLIYHRSNLSNKELITYSFVATVVAKILESHYTSTEMSAIRFLLLLHQMSFPCNAHSLYKVMNFPRTPTEDDIRSVGYTEFGAAAFPLLSLLNHACNPNVTRITLPNGINAVVTLNSILPNGEVLDNYGYHFATTPKQERSDKLMSLYGFMCTCVACRTSFMDIQQLQESQNTGYICLCGSKLTPDMKCTFPAPCAKFDFNEFHDIMDTATSAENFLLSNRPIHAFNDAVVVLRYMETCTEQPSVHVCAAQEIMKMSLFIATKDLFRYSREDSQNEASRFLPSRFRNLNLA